VDLLVEAKVLEKHVVSRCRQHASVKCWLLPTGPHGA
jgi:hypothetical protein